jgi:MFS family permease
MKKRILVSASLFHALTDASTVVAPMIFPLLYSSGHMISSYGRIGLLSNLGLLATFLVQFLVVRISYAFEYRTLLLVSLAGLALSLALMTTARTFAGLLALFLLLRIATSFYHPIVIAWISRSHAAGGLDDAMGIQSGSGNAGVLLAFLSVGYLAQRWSWRVPLFVWAGVALVLGTIGLAVLGRVSSRDGLRPALGARAWVRALRNIRAYIPGFLFGGMGWSITIYYAPSLLNHKYGVPLGRTGLYLALWIGLGTLTGYGYGALSRRFGRRAVFLASIGGGAASLFLIGLAGSLTAALIGLLAFGGFLLMTYPSLHTFVGSATPPDGQTLAFSWVSNIQLLSGALVTLLAGFLSDRFGIRTPFLLSGILAAGVFLFYALRDRSSKGAEAAAEPSTYPVA